jgi:ECF sigma factor
MASHSSAPAHGEITGLLRAWSEGSPAAFDQVMPLVYDELHRMAARYLAGERSSISI